MEREGGPEKYLTDVSSFLERFYVSFRRLTCLIKAMIFVPVFYGLCVFCGLLYLYTRSAVPSSDDALFKKFQRMYLAVYLMAMGMFSILAVSLYHLVSYL